MKRLYRSETDKMLAGICGGLGEELDVDSNIIRLMLIFACVVTAVFPISITYLVGWMILPKGKPK